MYTVELPKICRSFFPQLSDRREDNYIAGNSMGGYGAFKVALNNPESFGYVGCFSSAFDVEKFAKTNCKEQSKLYREGVFGNLDTIKNKLKRFM